MVITYRLYQPSDAQAVNDLTHRVFAEIAPYPAETWAALEAYNHVTIVAYDGDRLAGAIPFDLRDFVLRPGLDVRAAFAHLVGVEAEYRNRGVGSLQALGERLNQCEVRGPAHIC